MLLWIGILGAMAGQPTRLHVDHVRGKELYDDLCFQCHGPLALAETPMAKQLQAPPLAGVITKEQYQENITIIQQGNGMMPSFEMLIDKHDSKRILMYLSRLDPETGLDPNPKEYSVLEETESTATKKSKSERIGNLPTPISPTKSSVKKEMLQQEAAEKSDKNDKSKKNNEIKEQKESAPTKKEED